jgi:hypothetical protein
MAERWRRRRRRIATLRKGLLEVREKRHGEVAAVGA